MEVQKAVMYLLDKSKVCTKMGRNCAADGVCSVCFEQTPHSRS